MASTVIVTTNAKKNDFVTVPTSVAVNGTDGALVTLGSDERTLIIIENGATATKTVTIVKGTGLQGTEDLTYTVPASGKVCTVIESGKFLITSGENKGKVKIKGESTDIKVSCIALP